MIVPGFEVISVPSGPSMVGFGSKAYASFLDVKLLIWGALGPGWSNGWATPYRHSIVCFPEPQGYAHMLRCESRFSTWQLTEIGAQSVTQENCLHSGAFALQPRDIPLDEQVAFELLHVLECHV